MERKKKIRSNYKQLAKIGDKVIVIDTREIGTIKQIDNVCNLRDHNRSVNEYYIQWANKAWTRHDCFYFDQGLETVHGHNGESRVLHLTGTAKVLYG